MDIIREEGLYRLWEQLIPMELEIGGPAAMKRLKTWLIADLHSTDPTFFCLVRTCRMNDGSYGRIVFRPRLGEKRYSSLFVNSPCGPSIADLIAHVDAQ